MNTISPLRKLNSKSRAPFQKQFNIIIWEKIFNKAEGAELAVSGLIRQDESNSRKVNPLAGPGGLKIIRLS